MFDPSLHLSFCAVTPEGGVSQMFGAAGIETSFQITSEKISWEDFLDSSFHERCFNEVTYDFSKNNTVKVVQRAYGTDQGPKECLESKCNVVNKRECPFDPFSGTQKKIGAKCCCSGRHLCNKLENEFFGVTMENASLRVLPHCSRQSIGDDRMNPYPELTGLCEKSMDVQSDSELNLLRNSGVVYRNYMDKRTFEDGMYSERSSKGERTSAALEAILTKASL
ncbi:hypothetical protein L596_025760 [Steinernema carpocapsae]|uniref:Uncharacterized protein n=1 Tax=Steinernema carpocapsae TaxID=34508 RepID=A0A4U5M8R5_STECR|nr:hypothetical protein L596_025760 [Steinernema carpocapsae]